MPFTIETLQILGEPFTPKPLVEGWNRLEGRPRAENFERALRAEARDPLWFLTRQWQFLELKADDAGSPIEARVSLRETKLARYQARNGPAQDFPTALPLEAVVEREMPPLDRIALIQVHRAFDKALARAGVATADRATIHAAMRTAYPLAAAALEGVPDIEARQLSALADSRLFDAGKFLAETRSSPGFNERVDAEFGLSAALAAATKQAGADAAAWYASLYVTPPTAADYAWVPSRLDYQFACATEPSTQQTVLTGSGYANGRLDWYAVDVAAADASLGEAGEAPIAPIETTLSVLPVAVSFAGMPSHRYWELEDRKVEFGALTAHTTDIGKMLLTEFMLVYGNDWCVLPFEVDVGSLCDTLGIVVKDVFGGETLIRGADRGKDEDWRRWAMFGLETATAGDTAQPRIFIPPTTPTILESQPIERVVFLRDEMANLCWAVERTVLSAAGIGVDGEQFALVTIPPPPPDPAPAYGATARYRLGTDAPLNWRPFVPVHVPGSVRSVRLQRARLPRGPHEPLGRIIAEPAPYFINEEEAPRAGRIVVRTFQRTRWVDGRVVLWLGRRTLSGRGEGSSGLMFDVIEEVPARD
jgi:hypothetical protein